VLGRFSPPKVLVDAVLEEVTGGIGLIHVLGTAGRQPPHSFQPNPA